MSSAKQERLKRRRKRIYERDGRKCYLCNEYIFLHEMTLDHVNARCFDGSNDEENLKCCCEKCNSLKGKIEGFVYEEFNSDDYYSDRWQGWYEKYVQPITKAYAYFYQIVRRKHGLSVGKSY